MVPISAHLLPRQIAAAVEGVGNAEVLRLVDVHRLDAADLHQAGPLAHPAAQVGDDLPGIDVKAAGLLVEGRQVLGPGGCSRGS